MKHYTSVQAFMSFIGRFKKAFWLTAAVFAVADIAIAIVPWIIGQLTSSLMQNNAVGLWTFWVIAASAGHDAIWRAGEIMFYKLLIPRSHRFDDEVFAAIVNYPYSYFVDKFTGKISSYASSLGRDFRELLDNFHYQYVNLVVGMPIIAVTMFTVNHYTGYIFLASIVLMFLIGKPLARVAAESERTEADKNSTMNGFVVDAIGNFVSVKAFGSERIEAERIHDKRDDVIVAAKYSFFRNLIFWGVMSFSVRWIIWSATFLLNIYLYIHGQIDLAQLTTFVAVIVLFSNFIWEVIWNISQLNLKLAAIEEAYSYLFGKRNIFTETPAENVKTPQLASFATALELRDVQFAYPDKPDAHVLHDVNLTIKRGEKVGVVGPSGGGKSTLLKLLLGYYPIIDGQLIVDGKPVDNRSLTDLVAYVPQDTSMFHRSIRDNIAYGRQNASDEEVQAAARHAQAEDFIGQLEHGYETLVGERGVKLSGGQRQRVAIARAVLKDAPILMLDEATSALDSESEKAIQRALDDLLEDRTALVIAHRLSTIQKMDRIIVFDEGRIVETGSHSELVAQKGLYAKLWSHQTDGFIED